MHADWKHLLFLALYVSIGLIVAGMLQGVVGGFLNPLLGTSTTTTGS